MDPLPAWASTLTEITRALDKGGESPELHARLLAVTDAVSPDQPDAGVLLHTAGQIWARLGHLEMARTLLERALRLLEKALDPDEPYLALCLQSLAGVYLYGDPHRPADAVPLLQRALAIVSLRFGEDTTQTAELLHHLAQAQAPHIARPLLRQALAIYEKEEGGRSPNVAAILYSLAQRSEAKDARALLDRAALIAPESAPDLSRALKLSRG